MARTKASLLMMLMTAAVVAVLFALPYTPAKVVHTAVVERGDLLYTVLSGGAVGYASQQLCLSPQMGQVRDVYVQAGEQVKAGQLLMRMDTSMQEAALAQLQRLKQEGAAAMLSALSLEWLEQEAALLQSVQLGQIRAQMDGVVEAVYAAGGDSVMQSALLLQVRSEQKCVLAQLRSADCAGIQPGAAAVLKADGRTLGCAVVQRLTAPDASGMQQAVLMPADAALLQGFAAGEAVTAELVTGMEQNCALIPIGAVDDKNRVWYVEDGRAVGERIDVSRRSASAVAVAPEWAGRSVILRPEGLQPGCRVKEAKQP